MENENLSQTPPETLVEPQVSQEAQETKPGVKHIGKKNLVIIIAVTLIVIIGAIVVMMAGNFNGENGKKIVLATFEQRPYVGETLDDRGYVSELITEVAKRIGYEVEFEYSSAVRAKFLAEEGLVDGIIPFHYDKSLEDVFVFSEPFPGDSIGLLKRSSLDIELSGDPREDLDKSLESLQKYTIGVVRGSRAEDMFENIEYADTDLTNMDKLFSGEVDLIVVDPYTAADLMVSIRPHYIGGLEFMRPALETQEFVVAFSKKSSGYEQKQKDFQSGLQEVIKDGTLDDILNDHGLFTEQVVEEGKTRLTIATVNNNDMIVMEELSQKFEAEHSNIELEWRIMPENALRLRLLSDLAISDGQFDIITIGSYETPIWGERGWLTPLENLPEEYDVDDILPAVRDTLSYDENLYAVPFYGESTMLYYRTDLFEEAGITMPDQPTYEDIQEFAAILHDPENEIYGIGLRGKPGWGENMAFLSQLVNTFGGRWFDEGWNPTINSIEWRNALTLYLDLMGNYGPPGVNDNGFVENLDLFSKGKIAMWIDATVAAGFLFNPDESEVYDKVGFAPAPIAVTPKGSHWLWAWSLAIPESSNSKDAATEFITWATSKGYIELVAEEKGWVAVPPGTRKSTYENQNYKDAAPFSDFVLDAMLTADPLDSTLKPSPYIGIQYVGIPEFPAIGRNVGIIMRDVLDGNISLDEGLEKAQEVAHEKMRDSGYYEN